MRRKNSFFLWYFDTENVNFFLLNLEYVNIIQSFRIFFYITAKAESKNIYILVLKFFNEFLILVFR